MKWYQCSIGDVEMISMQYRGGGWIPTVVGVHLECIAPVGQQFHAGRVAHWPVKLHVLVRLARVLGSVGTLGAVSVHLVVTGLVRDDVFSFCPPAQEEKNLPIYPCRMCHCLTLSNSLRTQIIIWYVMHGNLVPLKGAGIVCVCVIWSKSFSNK